MAKEDDDQIETVDQLEAEDAKDQAQLDAEGSDDSTSTSTGLDSGSPYSAQLKSLLTQYQGALTKRSTDRTAILAEAQRKLLARAEDPMGQAAMYFKVAGALGKPTRTGSFGETIGNVGEALAPEVEKMQARKDALSDLQMKYKQMGLDQDVNDLGGQIGVISKLSQLTQGKQGEYQTLMRQIQTLDPKSPTYASDKSMLEKRMNKLTFVPADKAGPTSEVDRLTATIESKTSTTLAKTNAQKRLDRLNYIKPEEKPLDTLTLEQWANKLLTTEDKAPGTYSLGEVNRAKDIIKKATYIKPEEKPDTNLTLEQWANKVLMDVAKTPGSHPKTDVDRANAIIKKSTHIAPTKDAASPAAKPQSPAGKQAVDEGLTIGTVKFNDRVKEIIATGKAAQLSPREEAALLASEDAVEAAKTVMLNANKALAVNRQAYEGFGASLRRDFGRNIPLVKGSEGVRASTKLENLVLTNILSNLKLIFGGAPSDAENALMVKLEGSLSMTADEREDVIKQAMTMAARKAAFHEKRIKAIKQGAYTKATANQPEDAEPVNKADGGYIKMEDGGQLSDADWLDYMKGANVNYGQQGRQEAGMVGVGRQVGPGYASIEGHASHMPDVDPRTFSALVARYNHPVGQGNVSLSATQPTGVPVRLADLQASYPVGRGSVDAGVSASHYLPTRRNQVDARYLNLSHPVGSGTFNFGVTQPTQGPTQYNANYKMNFADGGVVRMEDGGPPLRNYAPTEEDADYSLANFARAAGQGAGFSFGDEAIARVRSQIENRPYEEVLDEERAKYAAFANKHPYVALGTELVSGAIPTVAAAFVPGGQAATVAGTANLMSRGQRLYNLAKASGSAGAQGFISGMGAAEGDMGDRFSEGAKTGAETAVLGPVIGKVVTKTGQGLKAVKNAVMPSATHAGDVAIRKVLKAMGRDDIGMQSVRDILNRDRALAVNSTLADVSPSLTSLGEAVITKPGPGRKQLGTIMEHRLASGRDDVSKRVSQQVGKGQNFVQQEDQMLATLRGNANNMYDNAYAFGTVNDPRIMRVLEDDTFKQAYKEARAIANKERRTAELRGEDTSRFDLKPIYTVDSAGNTTVSQAPDVRTLDYIKRGIDALIDKGYKGDGMSSAEASALKNLKKEFVNVIDEATTVNGKSAYKQARSKYAGDREVLDALELGRVDFLSPKLLPDRAKAMVAKMSDAEKDALRIGAAQSILTQIGETPNQVNAAQRVIGATNTRQRLSALFDDPKQYQLFEAALTREADLFRNAQQMVRGSRTANKTEAVKDLNSKEGMFDIAGEAIDMATSTPGALVSRVLKFLSNSAPLSEKSAAKLSTMLKASAPADIDKVLTQLEQGAAKLVISAKKDVKRQRVISGATSASAGTGPSLPTATGPALSPEDAQAKEDATFRDLMKKYATEE